MVDHEHVVGAPVLAEILPVIAEGEGLQKNVLTVVVVDALHAILSLVVPRDQTGVARFLVKRAPLHHEAFQGAAGLVAQPFVAVLLQFLCGDVLIGELAADEGAGFVGG